jgi:phage terminase small subunit
MQQRFVDEYLIDPISAAKCAERAGYSHNTSRKIAYSLMNTPKVRAAIEEGQKARAQRMGITQDRVLQELARIAFSNLQDVLEETEDGQTTVNVKRLPRDVAAMLGEVSITQTKGKNQMKISRVKLHDKMAALDKIAKHLGMFTDKHEHTIVTLEDLVNQSLKTPTPQEDVPDPSPETDRGE